MLRSQGPCCAGAALLVQHAEDAILSTVKPWQYREGVSVYERHVNVTDLPATEG